MLLFVAGIIAGVFFLVGWGWRAITAPSAAAEAPASIKIEVERRPSRARSFDEFLEQADEDSRRQRR
jgi:hypothetical protein